MNNRQNGRRRGRGGQQPRNGQPSNVDRGNRIDNRARGNAAQLLEKYKNLARDAQMQGDRVNTEYYLQFADHYFRVLSENRTRFEEQRQGQGEPRSGRREDYRDDFGQEGDFESDQRFDQSDQNWTEGEDDRPQQADRRPRFEPQADSEGDEAPAQPAYESERRPRRERNSRANGHNGNGNGNGYAARDEATEPVSERIEVDRLPQSLSAAPGIDAGNTVGDEAPEGAPRPRRRTPRRPRAETSGAEV